MKKNGKHDWYKVMLMASIVMVIVVIAFVLFVIFRFRPMSDSAKITSDAAETAMIYYEV